MLFELCWLLIHFCASKLDFLIFYHIYIKVFYGFHGVVRFSNVADNFHCSQLIGPKPRTAWRWIVRLQRWTGPFQEVQPDWTCWSPSAMSDLSTLVPTGIIQTKMPSATSHLGSNLVTSFILAIEGFIIQNNFRNLVDKNKKINKPILLDNMPPSGNW